MRAFVPRTDPGLINTQLSSSVRLRVDPATKKLKFVSDKAISIHKNGKATDNSDYPDTTITSGAPTTLKHLVETLGFRDGQTSTLVNGQHELLAQNDLPHFEAVVSPGNYDLAGLAKEVCGAMNPGVLLPFGSHGQTHEDADILGLGVDGVALWILDMYDGQRQDIALPASYKFRGPEHLNTTLTNLTNLLSSTYTNDRFTFNPGQPFRILSLSETTRYAAGAVYRVKGELVANGGSQIYQAKHNTQATERLYQIMGVPRSGIASDATGSLILDAVVWPRHPRTYMPMKVDGTSITIATTTLSPNYMYPRETYVVETRSSAPGQLLVRTTPQRTVTVFNRFDQTNANKLVSENEIEDVYVDATDTTLFYTSTPNGLTEGDLIQFTGTLPLHTSLATNYRVIHVEYDETNNRYTFQINDFGDNSSAALSSSNTGSPFTIQVQTDMMRIRTLAKPSSQKSSWATQFHLYEPYTNFVIHGNVRGGREESTANDVGLLLTDTGAIRIGIYTMS